MATKRKDEQEQQNEELGSAERPQLEAAEADRDDVVPAEHLGGPSGAREIPSVTDPTRPGSPQGMTREQALQSAEMTRARHRSEVESEDELPLQERSDGAILEAWQRLHHHADQHLAEPGSPAHTERENLGHEMRRRGLFTTPEF